MVILKLDRKQYELVKNDPIFYDLHITSDKESTKFQIECDGQTAKKVKKIVDN